MIILKVKAQRRKIESYDRVVPKTAFENRPIEQVTNMKEKTMSRNGVMGIFLSALLIVTTLGCSAKQPPATEQPAVPVRLAKVEKRGVQLYKYFTGITGADPIVIVPRIRGYIEKVCFYPGDIVEEGDILYEIEKFDYENDLETANAKYKIALAEAAKAKADYDREQELQSKGAGFTTQADLDRTRAIWDGSQANVESTLASVSEAKKQLERCTIKAPKRGKINRTEIEVGNLVDGSGSNPPTLTTIMPMDPIYVYCQITDSVFDSINNQIMDVVKTKLGEKYKENYPYDNKTITEIFKAEGVAQSISFEMGLLSDEKEEIGENAYPYKGLINYNENSVDVATGTVTVRGEIPNSNYMIYPGYICNIRISGQEISDARLVEEKAICYDLNEVYIWILDEQGRPKKQIITIGEQLDAKTRIVQSGLEGGETYVVDGTQKVREGCNITEAKDEAPAESAPAAAEPAAAPAENAPAPAEPAAAPAESATAPAEPAAAPAESAPAVQSGDDLLTPLGADGGAQQPVR